MKYSVRRANARKLYMDGKYSQKEIAEIVGVTEKTISNWANQDKWKDQRTASLLADKNIEENEKLALSNLGDMMISKQQERMELMRVKEEDRDLEAIAKIDKDIISIADAMSKTSAKYFKMNKNNSVNYTLYMKVMESIFDALRTYDKNLFHQTIEFQIVHTQEMALKNF